MVCHIPIKKKTDTSKLFTVILFVNSHILLILPYHSFTIQISIIAQKSSNFIITSRNLDKLYKLSQKFSVTMPSFFDDTKHTASENGPLFTLINCSENEFSPQIDRVAL